MTRFLSILTLFVCYNAIGQEIVFSPVEYGRELNEEQIRNITQLPDGRLIVFTEGVLNLFDGSGFKSIRINEGSTSSLRSYKGYHHSYIENNRLWFKNRGKLALINLLTEQCEINPAAALRNIGFTKTPADLFVDSHQNIWMLSTSGELYYHDNQQNKTITFLKNVNTSTNPQDQIYDIARIRGQIYIFYKSGLMRCFDHSSGRELYQQRFPDKNDEFKNSLFVVPVGQYLYQLRNGLKGRVTRFDTGTRKTVVLMESAYWFNCLTADEKGNFWLSGKEGIWRFESGRTKGKYYPTLQLIDGRKIKNEVSTIFCDQQGGIWAGTFNKGLYYYHPHRFKFGNFGKPFFKLSDVAELQVTCFEETLDEGLLIGTRHGLYKTPLPLDHSQISKNILPNVSCNALSRNKSGGTWIGTSNALFRLHEDGSIKTFLNDGINSIYKSKSGTLYFCTVKSGLLVFDEVAQSLKQLYSNDQLPDITQVIELENSLMGISNLGLFLINKQDNKLSYPLLKPGTKPKMFQHANHQYTCLLYDKDSLLWFGTYDGLNVWDNKKGKLYRLHTEQGLINNTIKAIIEDKDGSIWITTSRGVNRLYKTNTDAGYRFQILNYNKYDGVLERTFIERSSFLSPKFGLFMGGVDGFNVFSLNNTSHGFKPLHPVFHEIKLFGKSIQRGLSYDGQVILAKSLTNTDTLVLNHRQNFFSLSFSGLNYINPSQTYYRYMLEGVEKNWRIEKSLSGVQEAFYTDVSPGRYLFRVQASPNQINWDGPGKTLLIIIEPPFWNTASARIVYLLLAIGLITAFARNYNRRMKKRQRKREEIAIEKARSNFMTNISHELRTPLALIITPLKTLISKVPDDSVKTELLRINNNADILMDTVNQLLEYKRLDAEHETLNLSYCSNLSFIQEFCTAYQMLASEKGISFRPDIYQGDTRLWIDQQKALRIITNLLSNALKFTPTGGMVTLDIHPKENETLFIRVNDTGVGISEQDLDKIFGRFYKAENQTGLNSGSGIGLYLVKEYTTMHGGIVKASSVPEQGSTFEVTLSIKRDEVVPSPPEQGSEQRTLLIIEDNHAFRSYLVQELSQSYIVLTAENGKSGLEKAVEHEPDLVITDMMMPVMTGPEFCSELRKKISISHTPVIMLTARTAKGAEFEGYESGADAYLVKPFDITLLRLRIKKLLEQADSRKKIFDNETAVKPEEITNNQLDRELLERALVCVKKNMSDPGYSVEKFSADMNMDRTGLYRKLMALTGRSPSNFLRTIRLKKAAELLIERKLSISEIAEQVGFASLSYFTKSFHEEFAKSPSQFITDNYPTIKGLTKL